MDAATLEARRRELAGAQAAVAELAQREAALEAEEEAATRQARELGDERDQLRVATQAEDAAIADEQTALQRLNDRLAHLRLRKGDLEKRIRELGRWDGVAWWAGGGRRAAGFWKG